MSMKANPTVIGGFVVGAVVLAIAAVAYFGGGEFLAEKYTFVAFFEGSLKGLNIGAPVTFRGVRIGTVSNIVVRYDRDDQSVRIPVYFELEQGRIEAVRQRAQDPEQNMRVLIDEGLRAQLVTQSFVTGQIAVQLDFHDDAPLTLVGADPDYFEFPTIPSTVEKMGKALEEFDLAELLDNLASAIEGIDELAQSPKLRDAIASLDATIKDFGELARNVNAKVDPITEDIDETAVAARRTLDQVTESVASVEDTLNPAIEDARKLIQNVDGQVNPVVTNFVQTAETAQAALEQARETLAVAKSDIAEDSELYRSAVGALDELAAAARSIRMLADLLEQHPEALLQGKGTAGAQ
ncbi:MAG: MCE family protein [Phycisphaerales bacterium]|nr:MAG: MCE family protein [Phycisphaerales bacterium]